VPLGAAQLTAGAFAGAELLWHPLIWTPRIPRHPKAALLTIPACNNSSANGVD